MLLSSALWGVYTGQCLLGMFAWERGIGEFTCAHLPAMFALTRGVTLFFFCVSVAHTITASLRSWSLSNDTAKTVPFGPHTRELRFETSDALAIPIGIR